MAKRNNEAHKDFIEKMKTWNPMQEDFTNSKFNQYCSGPGAGLDPALQPSELAKQSSNGRNASHGNNNVLNGAAVPYLVFKNLPKEMTRKALSNICSSYGKVSNVRDSNKNDHFFVDFATVADMEAVYRALEKNTYGFRLYVGKQFIDRVQDSQKKSAIADLPPVEPKNHNVIDMKNRNFRASSKQHPRPHIKQKPVVSSNDYNSDKNLLQKNDPQRHFLIEDDAHRLERAGLMNPNGELLSKSKYNFRTGRAYIEMPQDTKKFVTEKSKQSKGHFDAQHNSFKHLSQTKKPQLSCEPCLQCQRICDSVCARCSQYFCGIECQRKSWPQHRLVCGKPEHVIKARSFLKDEQKLIATPENSTSANMELLTAKSNPSNNPLIPIMPRSGNLVSLTKIRKSNVVFVRSKTYEDNLLFFKIISAIQSDSKNLKPLRVIPKCGQVVVTKWKEEYCRAMILNTDNLNKINLIHIDYGVLDVKLFDELFEAPSYYCELPRLNIPVILKNVPDVYMTDEIRKFMYSYLDGIDLQLKYDKADLNEQTNVYSVELFDEATNQSFNKVIATLAKPVEPLSTNDILHRNFLKHQLLPEGENVELVVMDNSLLCTGCISCTTREYALEIQKFQIEVQKYGDSLPQQNYAPRVDELCIAKYSVDQKWYRGRCLDLVGDGHPTIVFFDYGNIAMVNIKDIRRYPAQFTFPIFTSDCEIEGLPEHCNEKIVAKLEQLITNGSTIKVDAVEVYKEELFHVVKIKKIIKALIAEDMLDANSLTS